MIDKTQNQYRMIQHMVMQKAALKLEVLGLGSGSRPSAYKVIKDTYDLQGSKSEVLEQFEDIIAEEKRIWFVELNK